MSTASGGFAILADAFRFYVTDVVQHEIPLFLQQISTSPFRDWQQLCVFTAFWCIVYVFSGVLNRVALLKNTAYRTLSRNKKIYYDGCVTSGVMGTVTGWYAFSIWLTPNEASKADRVMGRDPRVDTAARLMYTYFVVALVVDHVLRPLVSRLEADTCDKPMYAEASVGDDAGASPSNTPTAAAGGNTDKQKTTAFPKIPEAEVAKARKQEEQHLQGGGPSTTASSATSPTDSAVEDNDATSGEQQDKDKSKLKQTQADEKNKTKTAVVSATTANSTKAKKKPLLTDDVAFLLHHIAALVMVAITMHPFAHYHTPALIIWEISSPFLNYRLVSLAFGLTSGTVFNIMQALFVITFLLFRIVIGLPSVTFLAADLVRSILFRHPGTFKLWVTGLQVLGLGLAGGGAAGTEGGYVDLRSTDPRVHLAHMSSFSAPTDDTDLPLFLALGALTGNVLLTFLNCFWGYKIVVRAIKLYLPGLFPAGKKKDKTQ
ncbi:unnamed protein product [Amoebophrya sp. A120]|nr:unnamed protein product [Amoebophrya sp. A120]|eukprot:GSA120T00003780001.1